MDMYKESDFKKSHYKPGEVADILRVTVKTVQNYDRNGTLQFCRSATNRRMLSREKLIAYLDSVGMLEPDTRRDVIYACASGDDAESVMDKQVLALVTNTSELRNLMVIKDVGSSADDDRPGFIQLLELVKNREVRFVYITSPTVLSEFGYRALNVMFAGYGTSIVPMEE